MDSRYAIKDPVLRAHANSTAASQRRCRRLTEKRFSIISNACWVPKSIIAWGFLIIRHIGTYVMAPSFMKTASHVRTILTSPLVLPEKSHYPEVNRRRGERGFRIGCADKNVDIHFLHHMSVEEVVQKWERWLGRTHSEDLYFRFSGDKDLVTDADFGRV